MLRRLALLALVFVTFADGARAQPFQFAKSTFGKADPEIPFIDLVQVGQAPVIDGKLDDACWKEAKTSSVFIDEYAFPVKTQTTFQIAQKDDMLFVGVRCLYDPKTPPKTPPTNTRVRDGDYWQGEEIELFFDFDRDDTPAYYRLIITPEGNAGDFFMGERADGAANWDPKYQVKIHWTPECWSAEWAVPLAIFDRTKTFYENFGLNVFRLHQGTSTWSPMRGEGFHAPHKFGEVRGLKGKYVTANQPGLFRTSQVRLNDRVIQAKAKNPLTLARPAELVTGATLVMKGQEAQVNFEIDQYSDVAVWIEDAKGERVRHLAAGKLGANAPAPLQKNSLKQTVVWDLRNDLGEKVPAGKYELKVGVGSKANLERVLGFDPTPRNVQGIALDAKGQIIVVGGMRDEWCEVQRFDRSGMFLQMVYPPPARITPDKLPGANILDFGADGQVRFGSHRPAAYLPHLDQPMPHTPLVNSQGQIIIFGGEYQGGPARFYKLNADGSWPLDVIGPYVKEVTWQQYFAEWGKRFHFAFDPVDENVIYLSGLKEVHRFEYGEEGKTPRETYFNAVCKVRWGHEGPLEVVVGKKNVFGRDGGKEPGEFFDPQGIAFDREGNLWVCDRGNDRLQVFDRKQKFLRQIPIVRPYEVRISKKTGHAYVLSALDGKVLLTKMDSQGKLSSKPAEVGKLLKSHGGTHLNYWSMTLDDNANPPEIVFVRGDKSDAYKIERVIDQGDSFSPAAVLVGQNEPREYKRIAAGWDTDVVWAGGHWYDGNTGEYLGHHHGGDVAASRDGTWASYGGFFPEAVTVYPATWPKTPNVKSLHHWPLDPPALARGGSRGFTVAPNGDVYVARYYQWQGQASGRTGTETSDLHVAIDHYSAAGKLLRRRVVYELSHAAAAPVVDIRGNIYVTDNVGRKIGQLYEDDIAANLPSWVPEYDLPWEQVRGGQPAGIGYFKFVTNPLIRTVGTLYKFGPEGGGLLFRAAWGEYPEHKPMPDPKNPFGGKNLDWGYPFKPKPTTPATHWSACWIAPDKLHGMYPRWQDGVQWEFLGIGPVWGRYDKAHSSCACGNSRFAVDDFGRTYVPAAHRNTIRMLDTAGNELLRIGRYGNLDSHGPGSPGADVEIPLIYPGATALSKRALYITEWRYGRILKVQMGYHVQQARLVTVP